MTQGFQLSPQQKHLAQLQSGGHDDAYTVSTALALEGAVDPGELRRALERVAARYEILRTRFESAAGFALPVQVIDEAPGIAWSDVSSLAEALERQAGTRLDSGKGPVIGAVFAPLEGDRSVLLLSLPASCADRRTLELLAAELASSYGVEGDTGDSPMQYADLAQWQNELLASDDAAPARSDWRRAIEGAGLPALPFGTRTVTATEAFRPQSVSREVAREDRDGLERLAERLGVPLPAVLLASWTALMGRLGAEAPFLVGVVSEGRSYEELQGALGPFAKTLPHRCALDDEATFEAHAKGTAQALEAAEDAQEFYSRDLIDGVAPLSGGARYLPVVFEHHAMPEAAGSGKLRVQAHARLAGGAAWGYSGQEDRYDLRLASEANADTLSLQLSYDEGFCSEEDAGRTLDRLLALIASAAARPEAAVVELDLIVERERRLIVDVFARGEEIPGGEPEPVHVRVARHAERRGEQLAVRGASGELTYAGLDARANALAAKLRALGVGPDVQVALCCNRSPELLVGILGIQRAGGAYVPLDPSYPADRLTFMMQDTAAPVLVTRSALADLVTGHNAHVVDLDAELPESAAAPPAGSPDDLAYVIYTSGSTGKPKGVGITQRNLAWSTAARDVFYDEPVERYLLLPSFAFDSSVAGIFWTLAQGGTLVLPEDGQEREPRQLVELIAREKITHMLGLPSLYGLMLESVGDGELASLRTVVVAGEECTAGLVGEHWRKLPGARLYNEYGPTEATVWSTVHECAREDSSGRVPIGRPIPGARIYVTNRRGALVPAGAPGELCVGGPGVTRGYLLRDDLTAERFVPDAFAGGAGARLYRTGDLVRFRGDGKLDFLGRVDEQVKISGYRVELGEIETRLREIPCVEQAVVTARGDTPASRRLVAYLVAGDKKPPVASIRTQLGQSLPDHMVPSAFAFLEALPLLPNGKVDKKALPEPDHARPELEAAYAAPRDDVDRMLVGIWSDVLGIDKIGVEDGFFALGGNSIQAALLVNKLQTLLGEYIHVATLFRYPTISGLSDYLKEHYGEALATRLGADVGQGSGDTAEHRVDQAMVDRLRAIVTPLAEPPTPLPGGKNPRAAFILSPPRSGSTLLRAMLAGNANLFVPPELELLNFNTMRDRRNEFTGAERFLGEGLVRAVMQARACDAGEAERIIGEFESREASSKEVYGKLQERIGDQLLVDKTACYSLDPATLGRVEQYFEAPLYIHLTRHPHGMINSFVEVRLEQVFFRYPHSYDRRVLAELLWNACHRNILALLNRVPESRHVRVRFEDLLAEPQRELERLSGFLGVPFDAEMLAPYQNPHQKMLDGTSEHSKMQGDPRFHEHAAVNRRVADRWREKLEADFLGDVTWDLAAAYGYDSEADAALRAGRARPAAAPASPPGEIDVEGLSDDEVKEMLGEMLQQEGGDHT